jgi:chromate transporter
MCYRASTRMAKEGATISGSERPRASVGQLAALFLRLGLTAFGGPAAHVAMMENEVVRRRGWLSAESFVDLLGASNLIPGPSSTELAIFIGYEQAGWAGLLVGGVCFVLPAALLVGGLAWAYVRFGSVPQLHGALYGIKPVVVAVVFEALWNLAPKAVKKSASLAAIGLLAAVAFAAGAGAIWVLLAGGAAGLALRLRRPSDAGSSGFVVPLAAVTSVGTSTNALALFWTFLKTGAAVFGSGYVLLAFLRADLVERLHWVTEAQLLDAIAIGQVTPGPVFTTATFIGYLVGAQTSPLVAVGYAALATVGIFLPGFVLVPLVRPVVAKLRRTRASAFLDGVNVASLGLMAAVVVGIARSAMVDTVTVVIATAGAVALVRFRANSTWLILAGGALGAAVHALQ